MEAKIQKWGNSLAVRIPKSLAIASHITNNSIVDISMIDGKIIIFANPAPKLTLDDLLAGITPENLHGETDTGGAVGREEW